MQRGGIQNFVSIISIDELRDLALLQIVPVLGQVGAKQVPNALFVCREQFFVVMHVGVKTKDDKVIVYC